MEIEAVDAMLLGASTSFSSGPIQRSGLVFGHATEKTLACGDGDSAIGYQRLQEDDSWSMNGLVFTKVQQRSARRNLLPRGEAEATMKSATRSYLRIQQ